jgi:hypothetical protein
MLLRDNRIADASVIGNLERNASFFASSTLIILAGILTVLGASDRAVSLLADLPFVQAASREMSEVKLLSLGVVFVYAFFTFSWCMRQYNFAAVLVGSAPMLGERHVTEQERKAFAERAARVISMAANQFNYGLRAYYFGMAALSWFINPWFFIAVTCHRRGPRAGDGHRLEATEVAYDLAPGDREAEVIRLTAACVAVQERAIRRHPAEWVWMHQRWKTTPPAPRRAVSPTAAAELARAR